MIPGVLISIATFPGVIVHEMAHQLFCRLTRVAVFDVCYFRIGNPAGYVLHEPPQRQSQNLLIGIGPFLVNSLLAAIISSPAAIPILKFESGSFLDYVLIWLGISIGMHSFPSTGDANAIWESVKRPDTSLFTKLVPVPLVGLIYVGAAGSVFWLDLAYGAAVAMFLPSLVVSLIA